MPSYRLTLNGQTRTIESPDPDHRCSRPSGTIRVRRVACARDCGLVIDSDALAAQIEGNVLQTLSRTLHEEVKFDTARVTTVDCKSHPILALREAPEILIDLVMRKDQPPLGAGEASAAAIAASLGVHL